MSREVMELIWEGAGVTSHHQTKDGSQDVGLSYVNFIFN